MNSGQTKIAWRVAGPLVVMLLLLMLVLYQPTILYLMSLWGQLAIGEYAHGYLVLAISGYLIFCNRQRLLVLAPCPEPWALVGVVAVSLLWMVSVLVDVQMLQAVGLLMMVLVIVWAALGSQVIRVLALPILFISFAIPVWFPLSPVLQNLTADGVFWVIRLLGVPALRQDNMIVLPAGTMAIEEACSGLRYLLAALTLGTLYAYMNYSSLRARLIVVLVSAGSAVLANLLRVFIVVYLGYTTDMQHALVKDHLSLGWYLFGGLVVMLLVFDAYLNRRQPLADSGGLHAPHETPPSMVCRKGLLYYFVFMAGSSLLVSLAPAVVYQINHQLAGQSEKQAPGLPIEAAGWIRHIGDKDDWLPVYHGAVNQKQRYQKNNDEIALYIGYYPVQVQGKELINELNHINNKKVWRTVYPRAHVLDTGEQQVLEQLLVNGVRKQRLVWYWYNIAGNTTTNKYEAKVLQTLGLLAGEPWAFVVAVATPVDNGTEAARQVLKDFTQSIKEPMKQEIERLAAGY